MHVGDRELHLIREVCRLGHKLIMHSIFLQNNLKAKRVNFKNIESKLICYNIKTENQSRILK